MTRRTDDGWPEPTPELLEILKRQAAEGALALKNDKEINEVLSPVDVLTINRRRNDVIQAIDKAIQDPDLNLHYMRQARAALIVLRHEFNSQIKVFDDRIRLAEEAGEPEEEEEEDLRKRDCQTCGHFNECTQKNEQVIQALIEDQEALFKYPTAPEALQNAKAWLDNPGHDLYIKVGELLQPIAEEMNRERDRAIRGLMKEFKGFIESHHPGGLEAAPDEWEEAEEEDEEDRPLEEDCHQCPKYPVCLKIYESVKEITTEALEVYQAPSAAEALQALEDWKSNPNEERHRAAGELIKQALKEIPKPAARRLDEQGEEAKKAALLEFLKRNADEARE